MNTTLKKTLTSFVRHKFRLIFLICLSVSAIGNNCPAAITPAIQPDSPPTNSSVEQTVPLWKRSFEEIKAKAESGNGDAKAVLADRYRTESRFEDHYVLSYERSELTSKKNSPTGMFNLGIFYIQGQGVEKNSEVALQLFSKAFIGIFKEEQAIKKNQKWLTNSRVFFSVYSFVSYCYLAVFNQS